MKFCTIGFLIVILILTGCRKEANFPDLNEYDINSIEIKCNEFWKELNTVQRVKFLSNLDSVIALNTTETQKYDTSIFNGVRIISVDKDSYLMRINKQIIVWKSQLYRAPLLDSNYYKQLCKYTDYKSDISMGALWNELIYTEGGCFAGGQRIRNGRLGGNRASVFTQNNDWNHFFSFPKADKVNFLINQIKDTALSNLHTCPHQVATVGEAAIYCIQESINKNWFDLPSFKKYGIWARSERNNYPGNEQNWLQSILKNKSQRDILELEIIAELKN